VGWGFLIVVALQAAPLVMNTRSWALVLPPGHPVSPRVLAPMLLCGEAVNAVSPVSVVGGELVRVSLLRRYVPTAEAIGAVSLAAMTQFTAQVLFVLAGFPTTMTLLRRADLRTALLAFAAGLALFLAAVLIVPFSTRRVASLGRAIGRFDPLRRLVERAPRTLHDSLGVIVGAIQSRPAAFAGSAAWAFAAWLVGVVETLLILRLLGRPVGLGRAIAIETLALVLDCLLFFVPARMGTQEGGRVLIFLVLGLDPAAGLAAACVRRVRELVWAIPGLVLLGRLQRGPGAPAVLRRVEGVTRGERLLPD
jgi:glycosyltransferase 2 family protein